MPQSCIYICVCSPITFAKTPYVPLSDPLPKATEQELKAAGLASSPTHEKSTSEFPAIDLDATWMPSIPLKHVSLSLG